MDQEQKFREMMEEVRLMSEAEGNVISFDKIREIFREGDFELTDDQLMLVCDYLRSEKIEVSVTEEQARTDVSEDVTEEDRDAQFFAMYKHDLRNVRTYSNDELETLMTDFEANRDMLIQAFLKDVLRWIEPYRDSGVSVCDLVQEGNLGLIEGISTFEGGDVSSLKKHLKKSVVNAVKDAVIEQEGEDNVALKLLGRVNAVNDCAREMSAALGRRVGFSELSEKLNMTLEELEEINKLSGCKLENVDADQ